jgi:hypothetical protein
MRQRILLFTRNAVGFGHLLGGVAHAQAGGIFRDGRGTGIRSRRRKREKSLSF